MLSQETNDKILVMIYISVRSLEMFSECHCTHVVLEEFGLGRGVHSPNALVGMFLYKEHLYLGLVSVDVSVKSNLFQFEKYKCGNSFVFNLCQHTKLKAVAI